MPADFTKERLRGRLYSCLRSDTVQKLRKIVVASAPLPVAHEKLINSVEVPKSHRPWPPKRAGGPRHQSVLSARKER